MSSQSSQSTLPEKEISIWLDEKEEQHAVQWSFWVMVASQSEIFSCSESTCVLTFKSEREAQAHMDSGKHIKELESVSLYNTIRLRWAERVTGISNVAQEASAVFAHEESPSLKTKASSMGWALKATQKRPRLEEKVKAYLIVAQRQILCQFQEK